MIFGGLEVVVGGYLVHRHYKNKEKLEKQQQEEAEAEARRRKTFPGPRPTTARPPRYATHPDSRYHHQQQQPYKQACYAPAVVSQSTHHDPRYPQKHSNPQQHQPRPHGPTHAQTFNIPRRPVALPVHAPQYILPHSSDLGRTDSFSSLSHMPIANGSQPHDIPSFPYDHEKDKQEGLIPLAHPVRHETHNVYGNPGFSFSSPAFGATATSPGLTYTFANLEGHAQTDGHAAEDTNGHNRHSYAPSIAASTQLGERGPPPPYAP